MRFITTIPEKFKEDYAVMQTSQNLNKLLISGVIILLVQVLAVVSNLIDPFTNHQLILTHYLKFYYYSIGGHVIFLGTAYFVKVRGVSVSLKRLFVHCYTYYIIFWAAGVAVADQFQGEEIVVYYTLVFILAIILDIDTLSFLIIVVANHVMFLLLLTIYERFYTTVFGLRTGSTQIIAFILLLRFYLHELLKKNYIQKESLIESASKLKNSENIDSVTGLYSRGHWETLYRQAYMKAAQEGLSLGLCMVDIDAFSKYNKVYGHEKADALLRAVGRMVKQTSGKYKGVSTRYNGDAFIVYFVDISQDELKSVTKSIRQKIEGLQTEHPDSKNSATITVTTGIYYNSTVLEDSIWDFIYAVEKTLTQ